MMHWLNLILKSDQGLFLRQTQILRYTRYKNLQKQSNKDLFYTVTNPCPMDIEILKQAIILNPHTKLSFSSNDPYFYDIPRKKILQTDKLTIIRDFCRFEDKSRIRTHISYTRFEEKLDRNSQ